MHGHYPTGKARCFPTGERTSQRVEQCTGHTWRCSICPPKQQRRPEVITYKNPGPWLQVLEVYVTGRYYFPRQHLTLKRLSLARMQNLLS